MTQDMYIEVWKWIGVVVTICYFFYLLYVFYYDDR